VISLRHENHDFKTMCFKNNSENITDWMFLAKIVFHKFIKLEAYDFAEMPRYLWRIS